MRNNLFRLSEAFSNKGDLLKALEILDLSLEKMPIKDFDHYSLSLGYPEAYYRLGDSKKARETSKVLLTIFKEKLILKNWIGIVIAIASILMVMSANG